MSDRNNGTVVIQVFGILNDIPVALCGAQVTISPPTPGCDQKYTDEFGTCTFELPVGDYSATATFELDEKKARQAAKAVSYTTQEPASFHVCKNETSKHGVKIDLQDVITIQFSDDSHHSFSAYSPQSTPLRYGQPIYLKVDKSTIGRTIWTDLDASGADVKAVHKAKTGDVYQVVPRNTQVEIVLAASNAKAIQPDASNRDIKEVTDTGFFAAKGPEISRVEGSISTSLKRAASSKTDDLGLWAVIRRATNALAFDRYADFMNWIFCGEESRFAGFQPPTSELNHVNGRRFLPFSDTDAYRNVKAATEAFVMANCGIVDKFQHEDADAAYIADYVSIDVNGLNVKTLLDDYRVGNRGSLSLPYLAVIRAKLADERIKNTDIGAIKDLAHPPASPEACYGILKDRLQAPCLMELIWSYWQEEGMLVQTMNAVTRRFQNMRSPLGNDPLANMEIDPLRSLNNLLWGMIQDEQHRLSVVRRNYEYDHHYGLRLAGKAVDGVRPADSRSKFLEAFHSLLSIVGAFYKRDDDTTMVADGFPVLNALKEAHLILSQGAHNQFGDLPSTARIEMLMQQWILARPEFREFIPTRIMVAYPEPWMDRVDAMKKLQNWTDTSVMHFRNLAVFGEQILLGIRYGNWNDVFQSVQAVNWARYWRPQIQGYMHAYRSVTGVDLSVDVTNANIDAMMPSVHLVRRLADQQRVS